MGVLDKIIRGVAGLGLIFVSANDFVGSGAISVIFFVLGLILIFESMFGFCFVYKILGVNTNKKKPVTEDPSAPQE